MHEYSALFGPATIRLQIPDPQTLPNDQNAFWAKLWPSSIALAQFITTNPGFIKDKKVVELAAGLGLPGIVAAPHAKSVIISDFIPAAITAQQVNIMLNGLTNTTCELLDWHCLPSGLEADVLLLSDINYDPASFNILYHVLTDFLSRGTIIILTTPQRLMAKPFIARLLPFCVLQDELHILHAGEAAYISVLVLRTNTVTNRSAT